MVQEKRCKICGRKFFGNLRTSRCVSCRSRQAGTAISRAHKPSADELDALNAKYPDRFSYEDAFSLFVGEKRTEIMAEIHTLLTFGLVMVVSTGVFRKTTAEERGPEMFEPEDLAASLQAMRDVREFEGGKKK